ncbi:protein phosphatase 2C domain-containing protein [Merismopedia glauca]|nr:protein phosphatase 2C domain-containing protein [Merismopedia glauca]
MKNSYLWGATPTAEPIPMGTIIGDRYQVIAPNIWLDNSPQVLPSVKEPIPEEVFPYLRLYPYRLHLPEVQTVVEVAPATNILLLDNVPIETNGSLMPSIIEAWAEASSVRKVNWLWQILELWEPLEVLQVVSSLLIPENLRVDGWRVRLVQLDLENPNPGELGMQKLGRSWQDWFSSIQSPINPELDRIYQLLQVANISLSEVKEQLNQLLLLEAQGNSFQVKVAGGTDIGAQRRQNEDCCYPVAADFESNRFLASHLAIVSDGVGGHDAGEVASHLAVSSMKLQVQALLRELALNQELITPDVITEILATSVRVTNNLIMARNDEQSRNLRQRMATTLVMALQLPQSSGEVYIVHVGDSRAYWLSREGIVQLTVDDNVMTEVVSEGKSFMASAITRKDAAALTQALGVQAGELLNPRVNRFMVEEEGLLLLCSDGLSDNELLELHGAEYARQVLSGEKSVNEALKSLIEFANEYNGHDNISVVLTHFKAGLPQDSPELTPVIPEAKSAPPQPTPKPNHQTSWILTFVIAGLAIAGTVILALAMLSDRVPKPQPSQSQESGVRSNN